jgi:uncharacterized repeat protein (TIGR02543 family)
VINNVAYGTSVHVADNLSFDGYTFSGWTSSQVSGSSFSMPDGNVAFTGSWTVIPTEPPIVDDDDDIIVDPPIVEPPVVVTPEEEPIVEPIAEPDEPEVSPPTVSKEQAKVLSKTETKLAAQTGNPLVDLFRGNVPLGNVKFEGAWSLLSMLMSLVAVVVSVLLVLGAIVRRRSEDEIAGRARNDAGYYNDKGTGSDAGYYSNAGVGSDASFYHDTAGDYRRRGKILRVLTIILGVLTPVVWFVLDTLNQKVVWINKFTVYVGIAFVATVVLLVVYKVWKGDEKREAAEV